MPLTRYTGVKKGFIALLAAILLLSGCTTAPVSPTSASPTKAAATATLAAPATTAAPASTGTVLKPSFGELDGELLVNPFPPVVRKGTLLQLTLRDADGQAIEGANVLFDLTMPSMSMPPNKTQAVDKGGGVYEAQVVFTMGGGWAVNAVVTRGDQKEPLIFMLELG